MKGIEREALQLFCDESTDRLERIQSALERLAESGPVDVELLRGIFRETHSLKGGANVLNLGPVVQLAHRIEDILESIRSGSDDPDQELVGILSAGYGRIGQLLDNLHLLPMIDVSRDIADIERRLAARRTSGTS